MFKKEWCSLKFFNIAFFASVMWFWGLALATHKLELVYNTWTHFAHYFLYFTLMYFMMISMAYLMKVIMNFSDVKADFNHSVKSNFFPGVWKMFLMLAMWFLSMNMDISSYFWVMWVSIQSMFTMIMFSSWMLHPQEMKSMNPLWFLPIVWNMLAPVAWVPLGFMELSWFFFSVGLIMWAVMFTVIMNSMMFHNPLPQKLMPTLFILMAPPAVWFMWLTMLNWWEITELAKMLYYFLLFMFMMIFSKMNVLKELKFFMSWWAYSFPMAVTTTATMLFYSITWFIFMWYLGIMFYILLWTMMFLLMYKTYKWFINKELCIEE